MTTTPMPESEHHRGRSETPANGTTLDAIVIGGSYAGLSAAHHIAASWGIGPL